MTSKISTNSFEPAAWNLFASVALLASCTHQPNPGADETSTSMGPTDDGFESGTESDTTTTETSTDSTDSTDGSECRNDFDCDNYYVCADGECVECINTGDCGYYMGLECINNECVDIFDPPGQMCFYDEGCPEFYLCRGPWTYGYGHCQPAGDPPPDCEPGLMDIPTMLEPNAAPLALSFVDVDADGQAELVVATMTELLVYEFGVDVPTVSPRDVPSDTVQSMVAGDFDGQPGEDLALLVGTEHHRHFSDGVAGFVNPSVDVSPLLEPEDLLAGDFDQMGFTDLLSWGTDGAVLLLDGSTVSLFDGWVEDAAAFDGNAPEPGLLLLEPEMVRLFDSMEMQVAEENFAGPVILVDLELAAVHAPQMNRYASTHPKGLWTLLQLWNPASLAEDDAVLHPSVEFDIAAGDLDGDQHDEIATIGDDVTLIVSALADPCLAPVDLGDDGPAIHHAIGDHDGDGDDELALALAAGGIMIVDGE